MRRWALHCSWPSAVRLPMRKAEEAVSTEAAVEASTAEEVVASTVGAVEASAEAEVSEGDTSMAAAWVAAASHPALSAADRVLAAAGHLEAADTEAQETLPAFPMVVALSDQAADTDTVMATGGMVAAIAGGTAVIGVVTLTAAGPTTVTVTMTTIITAVGTTAAGSIVERCARAARTGGGDTNSA